MGGFTEWRNFFYNLFGKECFSNTLNDSFHGRFHYCIVDLTQFIVGLLRTSVTNGDFDTSKLIRSLTNTVEFYMNNEDNPSAPVYTVGVVLLLDSILHVPKNKVETQQSRDTSSSLPNNKRKGVTYNSQPIGKGAKYSASVSSFPSSDTMVKKEDDNDDEDIGHEGGGGDDGDDLDKCIMDDDLFEELLRHFNINNDSQYDHAQHHIFLQHDDHKPSYLGPNVGSSTIWRSHNLKWQLYRLLTHELLSLNVKENRFVIIDEGIAVANARFEEIRQDMMNHYIDWECTSFGKECFISNMTLNHIVERFILYSDEQFSRVPITKIGESDIKLLEYITPDNIHKGITRYLVVSQDTDIIFILLMHFKRLLRPYSPSQSMESQMNESPLEIWLDTQTPGDKAHQPPISRDYRFINVKRLYYCLNAFFHREYAKVENPIELLVFLVNSLGTDFTRSFHTHLKVTPLRVWNAFSELHYTPMVQLPKEGGGGGGRVSSSTPPPSQQGYVLFNAKLNTPIARSNTMHFNSRFRHILGNVIRGYQFDKKTKTYNFDILHHQIEAFFYQLCQVKVVTDLTAIGLRQFQNSDVLSTSLKQPIISLDTIDDIFFHVNEIKSRIEEYNKTNQHSHFNDLFIEKKKKPMLNASFKATLPSEPTTAAAAAEKKSSIAALNKKQLDYLKKMAEKEFPVNYGIPTEEEMKRRVYKVHWILRYYQNGSICPKFTHDHSEYCGMDPNLSIWGWKSTEIMEPSLKQLNSSYYLSIFDDNHLNNREKKQFPFRLFQVKTADHVFNRSVIK
jgi:hypothetical protein